jgi:hypothetical protein
MSELSNPARRRLLMSVVISAAVARLTPARAADSSLLSESDPGAKAVSYVEDASRAKDAAPGNTCANCSYYNGAAGAAQGVCALFPGQLVKAAGWCSSWSNM